MVPDPPDTIGMSSFSGPWPAFVISGVTGTGAAQVNTTYYYSGSPAFYGYTADNGSQVSYVGDGAFEINDLTDIRFEGEGTGWPWEAEWTPVNGAGGTLAFVRALAAPNTITLEGADSPVQASLTTALTGDNNDLVFTAVPLGRLGNDVRIRYVDPAANSSSLSIAVSGRDITINLATNSGGAITTTGNSIRSAFNPVDNPQNAAAQALLTVANAAGNTGTGAVTAMGWTALTGGLGGLPMPPETVAI